MKKQITNLAAVAFLAAATFFTGCKKDDVEAPVITLNGPSTETISLQGTYTEQGATATDNEDASVTVNTSGVVNVNLKGTYKITYSATDAAGNTGTAERTVTIVNDADGMEGTYSCVVTGLNPPMAAHSYTQTITASPTKNNRINFGKFGDYQNNTNMYADVTGSTVDLPSQTTGLVGNPATTRTFSGTGTTNAGGFSLNYTETTSTGTGTFSETFTKN